MGMFSSDRMPKYSIRKPPEQWSNGHMVHYFEYAGVPFKLMQRMMQDADEEEYTYLHVDDHKVGPDRFIASDHRWLNQYPPTFHGIISVESAVIILNMAHSYFERGRECGLADKQYEIKKVLGI